MRRRLSLFTNVQHLNITDIRIFYGLAGVHKRFVKDFSTLNAPLTEIVKKYIGFKYGDEQDHAFNLIKKRFVITILFKCLLIYIDNLDKPLYTSYLHLNIWY